MATRCNVVLNDGTEGSKVFLYRHWDGYLAECGADLAEKLKAAMNPAQQYAERGFCPFLTALISEKRGGEGHDADKAQYEVTDSIHGDIEHLYEFFFSTSPSGRSELHGIKHGTRKPGDDEFKTTSLTLREFVEAVNADRVATNKRLAVLRAESKHYADCADYPMLSLEGC